MLAVTEEELQATGLSERYLNTYRLAYAEDPPLIDKEGKEKLAERLGVTPSTVKNHLDRVGVKLDDPRALRRPETGQLDLPQRDPEKFEKALLKLTERERSIAQVAKDVGIDPVVAQRLAQSLEREFLPLKRQIEDIRLEDLIKRFGTLSRDAIDAITPEKLERANAQQLAVIAGIGADKWQILRGQPTQRMEISDRRKMDEVLALVLKEATRRGIEIDVTPEGGVTPKKSPYQDARDQRVQKQIESGDPAPLLEPV